MKNNSGITIETLIRARYPLIYVVSFEESRVDDEMSRITKDRKKELYKWSITKGLEMPDGSLLSDFKDPIKVLEYILQADVNGVFVMKDYHPYLNEPVVVRKLRDVAHALKTSMKNVVFISPVLKIPMELEKEFSVIDYNLPRKEEISEIIKNISANIGDISKLEISKNPTLFQKVTEAALGLTAEEAENVFAKSLVQTGDFDLKIILSEKEQIIRKSGVLEYCHVNENMQGVGGLDELKKWLNTAKTSVARLLLLRPGNLDFLSHAVYFCLVFRVVVNHLRQRLSAVCGSFHCLSLMWEKFFQALLEVRKKMYAVQFRQQKALPLLFCG